MARVREFDTDQVLAAAVTTFRQHGFAGTSVQNLVEATGIGRGSLYAAFGDKEGLYLAALDRYRADFAQPLLALLDSEEPPLRLVREILVGLVDEIVQDGTRQACLIVSAATELVARDTAVASRVRETTDLLEETLTTLLRRVDPPLADPRAAARFVITVVQGLRVAGAVRPERGWLMSSVDLAVRALA
ncbi:TetR/AcrR family transcriptional regulator [Nocardioides rubriscoriae]|uniref:TetR/AcrR family transcriptional regulator n=1 Tax=Nocardioides rubriscoriae TaxID=642762 RepID=UPI0011DF6E12|nr:TetR/AcrR family transcriptional regulator [Nocardioides rubriscoriae]